MVIATDASIRRQIRVARCNRPAFDASLGQNPDANTDTKESDMNRNALLSKSTGARFNWLRNAWWQVTTGRRVRDVYYARLAALVDPAPARPPVPFIQTETASYAR
jgi:hypothetical protein